MVKTRYLQISRNNYEKNILARLFCNQKFALPNFSCKPSPEIQYFILIYFHAFFISTVNYFLHFDVAVDVFKIMIGVIFSVKLCHIMVLNFCENFQYYSVLTKK